VIGALDRALWVQLRRGGRWHLIERAWLLRRVKRSDSTYWTYCRGTAVPLRLVLKIVSGADVARPARCRECVTKAKAEIRSKNARGP
jgi:hypothetical protein